MANNYSFLCLLGAIDRLWFHQTILFSEPMSLFGPKSTNIEEDQTPHQSISDAFTYPSPSLSFSPLVDEEMNFSPLLYEENSSDSPQTTTPQDDSSNEEEDEANSNEIIDLQKKKKIRPTRLNILATRMLSRSHSSDHQKYPRKNRTCPSSTPSSPGYALAAATQLQKSMSCRSLGELELEEVKGFMDLGFTFKKENLNPRMMSLVPGLQRLGVTNNKKLQKNYDDHDHSVKVATKKDEDEDGDEGEEEVKRPYLSEAWLIKRPDSPLLNLKLPRASAAADMKKHLKFWARTVASEIHQES